MTNFYSQMADWHKLPQPAKRKLLFPPILLLILMMIAGNAMAQTSVFTDDYTRATVSPGGTPSMTYTTTIGTGSGQTATIPANDFLNLQNSTVAGNIYVSGVTSSFLSWFNSTLSSNTGIVEWTFNSRYVRSTAPSGLAPTNYGYAIVLAGTSSAFHNTGNGYAIAYGNSGSPDPIRLVKYTNGLQGTLTDVITTNPLVANIADIRGYASVRVKYVPSTNSWSLYVRDDGVTAWTSVLTTPVPDASQYGTTVVDNTYTSSVMTNFGFFWVHSTTTAQKSTFDNFKVSVNVPVNWTSGWPKAENPTPTGFTAKVNTNVAGTAYFVVLPSGASSPSAAQVKAGQNAAGTPVASNEKGSITCSVAGTEFTAAVSGLSGTTTYDVFFVAEDGSGNNLQASPSLVSVTTSSSADAPSISDPTVISVTNNSAVLGGNITSDGGSAITDRGTVWSTSSGVLISDNPGSEGTTATGIFSHTRSLLPSETQIFYKAYATNTIGTALTTEGNFFTLADEPVTQATGLLATPSSISTIDLTWDPLTGADGFIILQRQSAAAPSGIPLDANFYPVGSVLGNGIVAAYVIPGTSTSHTISGLLSGTTYSFKIMAYNWDGSNYQTYNYLTSLAPTATATTLVPPGVNYTWNQTGSASWTTAANWTPTRSLPDITDILSFNGGGNISVTDVPTQTIGQLHVSNATVLELTSAVTAILTIRGETGVDMEVAAGSELNISGANAVSIVLGTGTNGLINGSMTISGGAHTVKATDLNSLVFASGSIFKTTTGFTGSVFGTTPFNAVKFQNGSTYIQNAGSNPFGASQPNSVLTFETGSLYKFTAPSGGPSYSGRVYANFENDAPAVTQNNQGSSPMTCDNYTVTSGTVNWDFSGGLVIKGNISVSSAATLTFGNATKVTNLTMGGSTLQTISGTGAMFFGANGTLTVNNAAGVSLLGRATLNNLAITTGTFTVASGASLITNGTVPSSVTVERSINAWGDADHGWHLLSSPVTAQAIQPGFVSTPPDAGEDFYSWDEATNFWINSKDLSGAWNTSFDNNFAVGKGYLVAYQNTSTRSFAGILNTSNVNLTGLTNSSGINHGWNLLGNPFASALKWNDGNWSLSNVTATAKLWDEAGAAYVDIVSNDIIPALNGFMVETSGSGALTIPIAARTHSSQAWYKNGEGRILLTARDLDNNRAQQSVIRLNNESTEGFDSQFDSHFLGGFAPKFYSIQGEEMLSTNSLPDLSDNRVIEMGFVKNAATSFSIELSTENQFPNLKVYLTDKKTGVITDLSASQAYSFTSDNGDDPSRFRLHFKDATSVSDPEAARNFTVFTENGFVNVQSNSMISAKVKITDMAGRTIATANLNAGETSRIHMLGQTGVYVVSLITAKGVSNEKIIVK
jgi:hypothetical protein